MNERTQFFIKNISLTLYSRKGWCWLCVRGEWRQVQTVILTQSSSDHSSTSSSSWLGCSTAGRRGPQALSLQADSHAGILSPTDSNWLELPWARGYIIVSCPPASAVLPLIYTGASLDWRLGRGSICYNCDKPMFNPFVNIFFFFFLFCTHRTFFGKFHMFCTSQPPEFWWQTSV